MRAINKTKGTVLCARLENAGGFKAQSCGLLGRDGLAPDEGLLFESGRLAPFMWMHMFFMRFAIDIVFLDRRGQVIRINRGLKPWRVSSIVFGARRALELADGAAERSATGVGDRVDFEDSEQI